ncbi:DUF4062 domain-containing protein [bacterium]|nr:DUF4062 domain-containing protein [bacterium]
MKLRVFVSSVIEGFEEYREAVKAGIINAGGDPVLVEDYPSISSSPRNACLDGVKSCDIFVLVIGNRGGWTVPSGKLVVEEEYEEACKRKLQILAFIQNIERDKKAQHIVEKVSDYVGGVFRSTFTTSAEIQIAVGKAIRHIIQHNKNPKVDFTIIEDKLRNPHKMSNESSLRFVLIPERSVELLDPVLLESKKLKQEIFEIGHSPSVEILSYECKKEIEVGIKEIVVLQSDETMGQSNVDEVRLELTVDGAVVVDLNVTGLISSEIHQNTMNSMVILEGDIMSRLKKCFAFVKAFFDKKDPFNRYDRMLYNVALSNIRYRTLTKELPKRNSCNMGGHGDEVIIAFDSPRLITRRDLLNPEKEAEAVLALIRRQMKSNKSW